MTHRRLICMTFFLPLLLLAPPTHAELVSQTIEYQEDGQTLEAYYVYDDAVQGKRPGVLVCHAWWGQSPYTRKRADMLAELGYAALALDMYGKGKLTDDPKQASEWATPFYKDRQRFRSRATSGLDVLKAQGQVDTDRLAVMGYCFGGTNALELAYSGADLVGVVTFHGSLMPPQPDAHDAQNIAGKVLICHGQADPLFSTETLVKVIDDLQDAEVDVTTTIYSGAVHAFTDPGATGQMAGVLYDKEADARSWSQMRSFLTEVFGE